jgi:peptidoglycan/xylan/chitin deacetylase (PgdA/CDA1 family)
LYGACADPPKKPGSNHAGTGGTNAGDAGEDSGGDASGATENMGGTSGAGGGASGSGNDAGAAGTNAAMGGEGGEPGAIGGAAGAAGEAGAAGAGPVVDPCEGVTVGNASNMPAPPQLVAVPKPDGALGNMQVINWAGFKGALSYTFDDGSSSQIQHYTELNAVGVPMTFYLVTNNDKSDPVWTQAAKDGHELGNHTTRHCASNGTNCAWGAGSPFVSLEDELDSCTEHIKSDFNVDRVYTFASPYGDTGYDEAAAERFIIGRAASDPYGGLLPNADKNPMEIPCHISNKAETAEASPTGGFNLIADDVRLKGSWRTILNHSFGGDGGYNPTDIAEVVKAMTYARDLQDVWVDTVAHIGAYWVAQKLVSSAVPVTVSGGEVYSWTLPKIFPPGQYLRVKIDGGTPSQCGTELAWDEHGYYEIALDAGSVTISP